MSSVNAARQRETVAIRAQRIRGQRVPPFRKNRGIGPSATRKLYDRTALLQLEPISRGIAA
ncbi:hypothetical protein LI99_02600 [Mycolicibacterium smegmatis]|uniref:Uncharacterized protein n=1 Tax=Mycolicibacterium smegmatis (strain ATCC 700084 / mc(2)155) TaxID=246196 RepID=A0QPU8_MYCS2|nr:hypothetical protein MSMEG_0525 [Mycolicibacterium smegmatis MC2 155]AIU12420.1 hypothetical protein LI99_02600 [Mycolicibacterium smegmatis]AIU05795.1 hypothetical protein LJ00_02600 [Mycolicibacterium smegmatis MC2 155]AIU19044.1 hypothetical protein LI98_02600 [Mycolicibacterium smegmatis]TBH33272.1 hypothetical protein EYS45_22450 [Mycolicibacterium smegmatis MC2 155]